MPVRAGLGRIQRTRQQSEDARLLRDYTNYVRANQRLHFQLLDSIMNNERNLFSLINQSNTPTNNIDEYSESEINTNLDFFEPREDRKGDISRTIFYFYTICFVPFSFNSTNT